MIRLNSPIFLFILFLAFLLSSCNVTKKYTQEATKWEKNIAKFEELDKTEQYPDDAVIFTGSSSIAIWSTIKEDMAPYHVIHRGFGGSKFSDLACYINRIVYPHKFQALVIYEGNDITGGKADKTPREVAGLFKDIVRKVRKKNQDQPIFVIEITPTQSRWKAWPQIKEANALLAATCKKLHNVYFIATSSHYLNDKGEPRTDLFRPDMLHQNKEGYTIWTKLIKAKLDEVLRN